MNKALDVKGISKSFKDYSSEYKRVLSWFGLRIKASATHQILQQISFSVGAGEAVGIVGQNGAGKSTLLKIITGTLRQSEGSIHVSGRISSILELGMGFQPDLTGRQNVYHSAGLMGFTIKQIDAAIDELEDFAEIGEYFDQPVRTYSSGMQMRVSFGVATMYRPDILIVDEALSVGDAYFQHKSFDRIRQFQDQGTSLLLVSHDKAAIQAICDRAILLEQGSILKDGNPEEVLDFYNALIADKENSKIEQVVKEDGKMQTVSGTGEVSIESVFLYNDRDEQVEYVGVGDSACLRIKVNVNKDLPQIILGFVIKDRLGQEIFGTNTYHQEKILNNVKKGEGIEFIFKFNMNLGVGSYSITTAVHADDEHISSNYEWINQALFFNIVNMTRNNFVGYAWLDVTSTVIYEK